MKNIVDRYSYTISRCFQRALYLKSGKRSRSIIVMISQNSYCLTFAQKNDFLDKQEIENASSKIFFHIS